MKTKATRVKAKPLGAAEAARLDREVAELAKLSTKELRARARPMTPTEAARWQRVRRGRPRKPPGRKATRVLFTIDPELLKRADQYARSHGLTRAQMIADGLRSLLSA